MKFVLMLMMCLVSAYSLAQGSSQKLSQQQLAAFASKAELHSGIVSNYGEKGVQAKLVIANKSTVALPKGRADWKIYIHSVRKITDVEVAGLAITHVQGDLHQIVPTRDFPGLATGDSLVAVYTPSSAMVAYTDFMPRAFIYQEGLQPEVFANTDTEDGKSYVTPFTTPEQLLRHNKPEPDLFAVATAQSRYKENLALAETSLSANEAKHRIIPTPKQIEYRRGTTQLDKSWQIRYAGRLTQEAGYLKNYLKDNFNIALDSQPDNIAATGKVIELKVNSEPSSKSALAQKPESYTLDISEEKIVVTGSDNAGAFYGIQSVLGLIPPGNKDTVALPLLSASDSPRAGWRGMHYDMGRNFHGKEVTLRLIEQMARYKLNKLHLHLTEDEGWRLEIPGLPELTDIGAFRCFDPTEQTCLLTQLGTGPFKTGTGNGFYSTADFIEILKYAAVRHIEVIPEIDMPGHARAAVVAMKARHNNFMAAENKAEAERYLLSDLDDKSKYITVQNYTDNSINVCLESTYVFADKVMYELQQMYRKAGLKLETFHMGGDEVGAGSWQGSPACQSLFGKESGVAGVADLKPYFVGRIAELANKRGLALAGWEDGLMYDATNTFNRSQFNNKRVMANAWDNIWEWGVADRAYRLANAGYEVIMSHATHLYFDHPHETHPEERGYYWAARYTDLAKVFGYMPDNLYANAEQTKSGAPIKNLEAMIGRQLPALKKPENILGIQGQVWTETIRTADQLEEMVYPRLIPLAERAWYKSSWESDKPDLVQRKKEWANFAQILVTKELPRLAKVGVNFYLPPPGAQIKEGKLMANSSLPGLEIQYSVDGGKAWKSYEQPVSVESGDSSGKLLLRTKSQTQTSRATAL